MRKTQLRRLLKMLKITFLCDSCGRRTKIRYAARNGFNLCRRCMVAEIESHEAQHIVESYDNKRYPTKLHVTRVVPKHG